VVEEAADQSALPSRAAASATPTSNVVVEFVPESRTTTELDIK